MTSDSDNKPDKDQPGAAGGDDFDEFDDFDDFDDFDEAAGLDAFDDDDDPFAEDGESDPDAALDDAVHELDAMVDETPAASTPEAPPVTQSPSPVTTASDIPSDDDFELDEFDTDEFEAEGFDPGPAPQGDQQAADDADNKDDDFADVAPAAAADQSTPEPAAETGSDDDADKADDFSDLAAELAETEEQGAEDKPVSPLDDDFADVAAAFEDAVPDADFPEPTPAQTSADPEPDDQQPIDGSDGDDADGVEQPTTPVDEAPAPENPPPAPAENDLDAMLSARASGTEETFSESSPSLEEPIANPPVSGTEEPLADGAVANEPIGDSADDSDAVSDAATQAVPDTPATEDAVDPVAEPATEEDTAEPAVEEPSDAALEPFEETPDPADEDADELIVSDGDVAGLGDEGAVSVSSDETLADPAAQSPDPDPADANAEADDDSAVMAEPLVDDEAADAPAAPEEPASVALNEPEEEADPELEPDQAAAAAAAAGAGQVAASEQATSDADDEAEPRAEKAPPRRKRKSDRRPKVPLIDVGQDGFDMLAKAYPKRLRAVQDLAMRKLTSKGLSLGEKICRKWADKSQMPYRLELDGVHQALNGDPGTFVINLGFEMACTTASCDDDEGGRRLLHTMDWKLEGLGRLMVAARRHAHAGTWVNITWPGYVGCLQGIAPGRFAAAINHAPINGMGPPFVAWPMSKVKWFGKRGLPPALLLRKVFDECDDFDMAVEMIERTPICYPAIFSLLGTQDGEFSVIERTETAKSTHKRAPAVTNHWLNKEFSGTVRAYQSEERLVAIKSRVNQGAVDDDWLLHPVLNPETRLAVDLNPTTARMRVRGYNGVQPVTSLLDIYAD
ncbi:MAG: hypothetical protein AAF213_07790 [Pseudomonadota bacterium]